MEIQSGHSELSVILQVSVVEGCPLSGVPLYMPGFPKYSHIYYTLRNGCKCMLCVHRKFKIVNPTSSRYEFEWTTESSAHDNPFKSLAASGFVAGGKKTAVI